MFYSISCNVQIIIILISSLMQNSLIHLLRLNSNIKLVNSHNETQLFKFILDLLNEIHMNQNKEQISKEYTIVCNATESDLKVVSLS